MYGVGWFSFERGCFIYPVSSVSSLTTLFVEVFTALRWPWSGILLTTFKNYSFGYWLSNNVDFSSLPAQDRITMTEKHRNPKPSVEVRSITPLTNES